MSPKTDSTPYRSPTIAIKLSNPHIAISPAVHVVVFVPLTVVMKTLARITADTVRLMIPAIKLAIVP